MRTSRSQFKYALRSTKRADETEIADAQIVMNSVKV